MAAEVPLDVFEVLVGGDHGGGVELGGVDGGAQDVEPVQGGFRVDPVCLRGDGEVVVGDGELEVLAGLVRADHLAHPKPIAAAPASWPADRGR